MKICGGVVDSCVCVLFYNNDNDDPNEESKRFKTFVQNKHHQKKFKNYYYSSHDGPTQTILTNRCSQHKTTSNKENQKR